MEQVSGFRQPINTRIPFNASLFKSILSGLENFEQAWDVGVSCENNTSCPSKFRSFIFRQVLQLADDEEACRGVIDCEYCPKDIRLRAGRKLKLIKTFGQ